MCVSLGQKRETVDAPSSRSLRATTSLQSICASAPTRTSTMAQTPASGPALRFTFASDRRRRGADPVAVFALLEAAAAAAAATTAIPAADLPPSVTVTGAD